MTAHGRSLELFFIDGRADGMLTAEVFNWTGHVLKIPRTRIKEGLARPEARHTGVYVLIGEKEGRPLAYIGEAESMRDRLKSHVAEKNWWEHAVLISTSADALHKAHVKFLESRLVEIAKKVGATALENANIPPQSSLSEAAKANMESFIETLNMVLPAIRIDMFLDKSGASDSLASTPDESAAVFSISRDKLGVFASAEFSNGEMRVKTGSRIRKSWVGKGSWDSGYRSLRDQLITSGVISKKSDELVFEADYSFTSPSAAAAVALGRASNGRIEWKLDGSDMTYAEWETARLTDGNPKLDHG